MDYTSLMVHLDFEPKNDARLRIAGQMAARFGARVIGVAASDPQPPVYADGIVATSLIAQDRQHIKQQLESAEQRFKTAMEGYSVEYEWRQAFERPATFIARQARAADLLITGLGRYELLGDPRYALDPSELILQAGRPMLIVPPEVQDFSLRRIVVGWKNTREARRAIWDALPLLRAAEAVIVATIREADAGSDPESALNDVLAWLKGHQVIAAQRVLTAAGETSETLSSVASDELADLLVAGAYGRSRLGEWIWGGVSQKLMSSSEICCLLSH